MTGSGDNPETGIETGGGAPLPGAMAAGNAHHDLKGSQAAVAGDMSELDQRIKTVQTRHEHDVAYMEAHLELEIEEIEGEREPLLQREAELELEVKSDRGKVAHWTGRLRAAAREVNAKRSNQLLYAAFVTNGDTSNEGLARLEAADGTVRQNGGETFVVVQNGHVAFGRIGNSNDGLIIDTDRHDPGDGIAYVQLPVFRFGKSGEGQEGKPSYGWISGNFDKSGWDKVLFRGDDEEDKVAKDVDLCKFQSNGDDLHLPDPSNLVVVNEFEGEVDSEEDLSGKGEDRILTGDAAVEYLHAFIDDRLARMYDSPFSEARLGAIKQLSNVLLIGVRHGIAIDATRFKKFKPDELTLE